MVRIVCRECRTGFASARTNAVFCGPRCKNLYNNRRAKRGAVAYDLLMALRYERTEAKAGNAWSLLCRLAQSFKSEDDRERGGRQSWDDLTKVKQRIGHLNATAVSINAAGIKRPRS